MLRVFLIFSYKSSELQVFIKRVTRKPKTTKTVIVPITLRIAKTLTKSIILHLSTSFRKGGGISRGAIYRIWAQTSTLILLRFSLENYPHDMKSPVFICLKTDASAHYAYM